MLGTIGLEFSVAMLVLRTTAVFGYSVRRCLDKMIRNAGCSRNTALPRFVLLSSTVRQSVCVLCSCGTKCEQCGLRDVITCMYAVLVLEWRNEVTALSNCVLVYNVSSVVARVDVYTRRKVSSN